MAIRVLISLAVGAAIVPAGRLEYRGGAVFVVNAPPGDLAALKPYQAALTDHAWSTAPTGDSPPRFRWEVLPDAATGVLRLDVRTDSRTRGQRVLSEVAQGYLRHLRELAESALNRPSEKEVVLQQRLDDLRAALSKASLDEQAQPSALVQGDVPFEREQAGDRLGQLRAEFLAQREQLRQAEAVLAELEANPVPERPSIDPDLFEQGLQADVPLQQDSAELEVREAEVRLYLLNAWQSATPALEELVTAASELQGSLSAEDDDRAQGTHRAALELAIGAVDEYRSRLRRFSQEWTAAFIDLSRDSSEAPASSNMIEVQEQIAKLLADFLYEAASSLTVIRDQARRLNTESDAQARHHVLIARLTRGFHALQTAHHQFEFSASQVQPASNFRLAAAVRAVRGLARRTELRREELSRQIEQVVRRQREQAREADIRRLQDQRERLTVSADAMLDAVFENLDEFEAVTAQGEAYAAAQAASAIWTQQVAELEADIGNTQAALEELANQRRSPVRPEAVRLLSCELDAVPANLPRRLAYGWAAFATTLLALLGIQKLKPDRCQARTDDW